MRAREPDRTGLVDSADLEISFEVYDSTAPTLLMVPAAPITHSRSWKTVVPTLARHYRVVTMDGRGNGKSGNPASIAGHSRQRNVADLVSVLDATDTERAVVVAHCHANWWTFDLAMAHRDRVEALVMISPGLPYIGTPQQHWLDTAPNWDEVLDEPVGWDLFNRHTLTKEHRKWVEFFFGEQLVEPHSTKPFEDMVGWALESTGAVLADSEDGIEIDLPDRETFRRAIAELDLPVLAIHGANDVCQSVTKSIELAEMTGREAVLIEGGGHLPHAKDPVKVNMAIRDFVERVAA